MNQAKFIALKNEFSWLMQFISVEDLKYPEMSVRIERIDLDLLARKPIKKTVGCGYFKEVLCEEVYLLDYAGIVLAQVGEVKLRAKPRTWYRWFPRTRVSKFSESIGQAVDGLQDKNAIVFIVCVGWESGWSRVDGSVSDVRPVTICKLPKGYTLSEWHGEQLRRAKADLNTEISRIDAEAETQAKA